MTSLTHSLGGWRSDIGGARGPPGKTDCCKDLFDPAHLAHYYYYSTVIIFPFTLFQCIAKINNKDTHTSETRHNIFTSFNYKFRAIRIIEESTFFFGTTKAQLRSYTCLHIKYRLVCVSLGFKF